MRCQACLALRSGHRVSVSLQRLGSLPLDTLKVTHLFSTHAEAWWRNYVTPCH